MEITNSDKGGFIFEQAFLPVTFISNAGEKLTIQMRDSGFEVNYFEKNYDFKGGEVTIRQLRVMNDYVVITNNEERKFIFLSKITGKHPKGQVSFEESGSNMRQAIMIFQEHLNKKLKQISNGETNNL